MIKTIAVIFILLCSLSFIQGQDQVAGRSESVDDLLKNGFDLLSKQKYSDARTKFETALSVFDKEKMPSEWLFTKFTLSDENEGDARSKDPQVRQFMGYRHAMGTHQALLMFTAFTSQLQGDRAAAEKYTKAIYDLQSPLWGLSWRMFIPPVEGMFHLAVPAGSTESYGRYEFMAGKLLYSAEQEDAGIKMMKAGQKLLPDDAAVTGELAGYLMISFNAAEARLYGEKSIKLDPKQGSVYIDLATACWLLSDLDAAARYADEAHRLLPDRPGPHATLALVALEKNDLTAAAKEADEGVRLSKRFSFYLTVKAIVSEAAGEKAQAEKLMREAWPNTLPDKDRLEEWFFRGKSLDLALKIISRLGS